MSQFANITLFEKTINILVNGILNPGSTFLIISWKELLNQLFVELNHLTEEILDVEEVRQIIAEENLKLAWSMKKIALKDASDAYKPEYRFIIIKK